MADSNSWDWLLHNHWINDTLIPWIFTTPLHEFMEDTPWAFPTGETLHFMGLTLLIGSVLVFDLRGIGMLRQIPLAAAHKLTLLAIIGFGINLASGTCFVFTEPGNYFSNLTFWWKMLFVLLAGLNAVAYEVFVWWPIRTGKMAEDSSLNKTLSALSLVFWMLVLIFGRFLPFTET
jgi:hypothetical protein